MAGLDRHDDPRKKPTDPGPAPQPLQPWLVFLWLAMALLLLFYFLGEVEAPEHTELTYTEFRQAVQAGHVTEVTLRGQNIEGRLSEEGREALEVDEPGSFETIRPEMEDTRLLEFLEAQGVHIAARPVDPPWWQQLIVGALPWLLILALLIFVWTRMMRANMGGGGPFSFGQSKAKKFRREDSHTHLDDVAGSENAKRDILEMVEFLKDPDRFHKLGAKVPRGVLMLGPPGTGKTLMAKAIAGEASVPFFSISGSEFIEMFVGVGAARVRDMFKQAKEAAPAVIFIDEIDAVGRSRGTGMGGGHDEREQTLNQILSELDGFEEHESVVVLAATNRPDVLDPALLRPGRFDRKILLEQPHREARHGILKVHTKKMPLADDVDLGRLAESTLGFSGADLANLANEAALLAGRRQQEQVDWACFSDARYRILLGEAREARLSEQEQRIVAYHESGHALLAYLLPHADPLEKVTILPRGRALGVTAQVPSEERYNYGEAYLRDRIGVMLGGRTSESIIFGEVSSGAENDLKEATRLARRMVGHWGMSARIGPVAFPQGDGEPFLGKELAQGQREYSEATAEVIDEEVSKLITDLARSARSLLEENRHRLEALATALLEHESLEADRIREVIEGAQPQPEPTSS